MCRFQVVVFVLLLAGANSAQERRIPVSVSRKGNDQIGALFVAALNQELKQSAKYRPMPVPQVNTGLRFFVELATVDFDDGTQARDRRSAVSVVAEDMGLPSSWPVATKWYHKVVIIDQKKAGKIAKELLEDMDARWCNYIRNSVGGCPKETLSPTN
jgi:hypothetical protein